jgi:hypothetical protein
MDAQRTVPQTGSQRRDRATKGPLGAGEYRLQQLIALNLVEGRQHCWDHQSRPATWRTNRQRHDRNELLTLV